MRNYYLCRMEKKVLVTGASGFIGSFLVEAGLERDMQVWAGVRKSSSRRYLRILVFVLLNWTLPIQTVWKNN